MRARAGLGSPHTSRGRSVSAASRWKIAVGLHRGSVTVNTSSTGRRRASLGREAQETPMHRLAWLPVVSVVAVTLIGIGCGDSSHDSNFGAGDDASTGADGSGDDGGLDDAISFGDSGEGGGCTTHCSSDLHSVLDCNNKVLTMCPPDQGCAGNGCVAPCDSAKANKSTFG